MDLSNFRKRIEFRSLRFDLLMACAAISMGSLVAYVVWAATPLEGQPLLAATVVGSAGFLAVFLSYGARDKSIALARAVGAEAGWLGFLWILNTEVVVWIYIAGWFIPGIWWVLFVVIAFACVSVGLIGCDRAWTWISRRVGRRSPIG